MTRTVPFRQGGQTWHLLMNGAALFDIYEKFGSKGFVLDHIRGAGRETLEPTCWLLAKLAEQGELLRRYQGYDKGPIPDPERFQLCLSPLDVLRAKRTITMAVQEGFRRDEDESKSVDKGLLELEKKTEAP